MRCQIVTVSRRQVPVDGLEKIFKALLTNPIICIIVSLY